MKASRVKCTNCIIIVGPKTLTELISIILDVRSTVGMICRYGCFIGGNHRHIISYNKLLYAYGGNFNARIRLQSLMLTYAMRTNLPWQTP